MRGRRLLCEKPLPRRSLPKRQGMGDSRGEAASLREAPLPQTPSPEERLAFRRGMLLRSWFRLRGGALSVGIASVHGG